MKKEKIKQWLLKLYELGFYNSLEDQEKYVSKFKNLTKKLALDAYEGGFYGLLEFKEDFIDELIEESLYLYNKHYIELKKEYEIQQEKQFHCLISILRGDNNVLFDDFDSDSITREKLDNFLNDKKNCYFIIDPIKLIPLYKRADKTKLRINKLTNEYKNSISISLNDMKKTLKDLKITKTETFMIIDALKIKNEDIIDALYDINNTIFLLLREQNESSFINLDFTIH